MALALGLKLGRQEPISKRLRGALKGAREGQEYGDAEGGTSFDNRRKIF
jgi:hypothetical protein